MMNYDELDPAAILEALGLLGATVVGRVTGGNDTAVWRVTRGNDAFALRVFGPGRAESCHREAETMSAAGAAGLPVPRVHALGAWEGHPAVLISWCAGRTLLQELQSRPWRIWPLGLHFGRMQARIHAVAAPPVLRQRPEAWIQWAGPEEVALQERLRALAPGAAALLHLDYHPLNVMTDGTRITGVLDWVNALAGDPRADWARTYTILRMEPITPEPPLLHLALFRRAVASAWKRGYEQVAGPLTDLAPFYVWAGAVMLRDLAPRVNQPGHWLRDHHFDPLRRWISAWKRRAGLPASG